MIAWLLVVLTLTLQLPDSSSSGEPARQNPESPRFWVQAAEKGSAANPKLRRLTVQTSALPEVGAAQFDLVFAPDKLEQPELLAGKLLGNALLESNLTAPGRLRVAFVSSEPISSAGELVIFQAIDSGTSPSVGPEVRLENIKAWKSADSTELAIQIGQAEQPVASSAASSPTTGPTSPPASVAGDTSATQNPTANPNPTNVQVTLCSPLEVHLELPGWLYFIAGSLTTLIAGAICLFVWKRN
jgi:hypothetical protein